MRETARCVGEREVLLVLLHRQDQALLRHGEERGIEGARVDGRPLDQRRDLVEQRVRGDQRRGAGVGGERLLDRRTAVAERRDDLAFGPELVRVRIRGGHVELAAAHEAMPLRAPSRGESERGDGNDLGAVQRHQAMGGADELLVVVIAAGTRVAHHLRDRQLFDRLLEGCLQARRKRHARSRALVKQRIGFAVRLPFERRRIGEAERRELFRERCGGLPGRVEGHRCGQHLLPERLVGRFRRHAGNRHAQPPRACESRIRDVLLHEPPGGELRDDVAGERLAEALQRLRRELFGDELDDERGVRHAVTFACCGGSIGNPSASRDSTYAVATSRERLRMRPMYAARSVTEIAPRASSRLNVWPAFRIIS